MHMREEMWSGQAQSMRHRRTDVRQQVRVAQIRMFDRSQHRDRPFLEMFHTCRLVRLVKLAKLTNESSATSVSLCLGTGP